MLVPEWETSDEEPEKREVWRAGVEMASSPSHACCFEGKCRGGVVKEQMV